MQSKSIKLGFALFALLTTACDALIDPPIQPCSGACEGLELTLDSISVIFPRSNAAYSGADVRVILQISNRGTVANDSNTYVNATLRDSAASAKVAPLRPGDDVRIELHLKYPLTSPTSQLRDSVFVRLFRAVEPAPGPEGYYHKQFAARYSRPFDVISATFELRLPTVVRYPSSGQSTVEIVVTNPIPRELSGGIVDFCVPDSRDYCLPNGIEGFPPAGIASIPAEQTVTIAVPLTVTRSHWIRLENAWQNPHGVELMVCVTGSCRSGVTRFEPDFEKFCAVRRLERDVLLTGSTVGRCGIGTMMDRLDIVSFEAVAGSGVSLTATGVGLDVYTATGTLIGRTNSFAGAQVSFTPPYTGRFYALMVAGNGTEYTLQLAANP